MYIFIYMHTYMYICMYMRICLLVNTSEMLFITCCANMPLPQPQPFLAGPGSLPRSGGHGLLHPWLILQHADERSLPLEIHWKYIGNSTIGSTMDSTMDSTIVHNVIHWIVDSIFHWILCNSRNG